MSRSRQNPAEWLAHGELAAQPQFVSTLANGLAVLACFGAGDASLSNKDLAERLALTRPTISRLTFTLTGLGFLRRRPETGRYALGPGVLSLGYPLLAQLQVRHAAGAAMLALARFAHGPVSIGTRDRLQVVYVETVQAQETSHTKPDIGTTRPLLSTAIGRALLHLQDAAGRARVVALLQRGADAKAKQRDARSLRSAFQGIETRGYCLSWGDWDPTLGSAAVPMRSPVDDLPLAFNVTVPTYLLSRAEFEAKLAPRLVSLVRNVEYRMGLHER